MIETTNWFWLFWLKLHSYIIYSYMPVSKKNIGQNMTRSLNHSKESSNKSSTPTLNNQARCHPRRGGTFAPPKRYTLLVAAEQLTCCCCNAVVGWTILSESLAKNQQLGDGRKYHRYWLYENYGCWFVCCISSWSTNEGAALVECCSSRAPFLPWNFELSSRPADIFNLFTSLSWSHF